jgi:hypothetical protein
MKKAFNAINPFVSFVTAIQTLINSTRDLIAATFAVMSSTGIRDALGGVIIGAINTVRDVGGWAYWVWEAARRIVTDIADQFFNFVGTMRDALYQLIVDVINSILGTGGASPLSAAGFGGGGMAPANAAGGASSSRANTVYGGNTYFNMTVNSMASASTVTRDFGIMRALVGG